MSYTTAGTSSGSLAVGTTVVQAKPSVLLSITLNPGSAASTVVVWDNASAASGKILWQLSGSAAGSSVSLDFSHPTQALNGLTVVVSGAAATASINYQRTY